MPKRTRKDGLSTQGYSTTTQVINTLRQYLQDTPDLHASHAAQGITTELQRLWQAADTTAAQGEQTTIHLQLGPPAAANKRTQEASGHHEEWRQRARAFQQRSGHLSAWQVAQRLAEDGGYSKHTIYKIILPLWRK
jgi:hypothetical protein